MNKRCTYLNHSCYTALLITEYILSQFILMYIFTSYISHWAGWHAGSRKRCSRSIRWWREVQNESQLGREQATSLRSTRRWTLCQSGMSFVSISMMFTRENEPLQLTNEFYYKTHQQAIACADAGQDLSSCTLTSTNPTGDKAAIASSLVQDRAGIWAGFTTFNLNLSLFSM